MKKLAYLLIFSLLIIKCQKDDQEIGSSGQKYTITITAGEGGSVTIPGGEYTHGTELIVNAIPDNGYAFLNWEGIDSDEASLVITVNSNLTLTAQFIEQGIFYSSDSELPFIHITTETPIQNEPKVPGKLKIYEKGSLTLEHPIGIEYRGSTSYRLSDKKSYGIETWNENNDDVNVSLLGFPKEEDWILMGHVHRASENIIFDPTLMRHYIAYELSRSMGNYSSRCKFVEVSINGDYGGTYILMEKLKRDKNRIDIKKLEPNENDSINITGGYILKIDKTAGSDVAPDEPLSYYDTNWDDDARYSASISFRSEYSVYGEKLDILPFGTPYHSDQYLETYFIYEYPKASNLTFPQKNYIQNYIHEFESALLNEDFSSTDREYLNYIDLKSFVDFFIMNELTGNVDAYRISTFLHKDLGKKLKLGPVWDFNIGYNGQDRIPYNEWIVNYNDYIPNDTWLVPFWWDILLEDPVFIELLQERWSTLRNGELSTQNIVSLIRNTERYLIDNGAIERNYDRWSGITVNYPNEIDNLINFLTNRTAWMDNRIENM